MKTVRKYSDPHAARMAKAELESAGLFVFLKNENFAETMPMYGAGMTVVELQVEKEEVEKALEILGPDVGNREEVERISKRLNKLFGLSLLSAVIGSFIHSYSYGFRIDQVPNSIGIGFLVGITVLLIQVTINKFRAQPDVRGERPR